MIRSSWGECGLVKSSENWGWDRKDILTSSSSSSPWWSINLSSSLRSIMRDKADVFASWNSKVCALLCQIALRLLGGKARTSAMQVVLSSQLAEDVYFDISSGTCKTLALRKFQEVRLSRRRVVCPTRQWASLTWNTIKCSGTRERIYCYRTKCVASKKRIFQKSLRFALHVLTFMNHPGVS